jgi:hypothetical protein
LLCGIALPHVGRHERKRPFQSSSSSVVSATIDVIVAIGFPLSVRMIDLPALIALIAFEKFWLASRNPFSFHVTPSPKDVMNTNEESG